jgi:hypothetical protein
VYGGGEQSIEETGEVNQFVTPQMARTANHESMREKYRSLLKHSFFMGILRLLTPLFIIYFSTFMASFICLDADICFTKIIG